MSNLTVLILLSFVFIFGFEQEYWGRQSYRIKGQFICGNKSANNVFVTLVEQDYGPRPEDILTEGFTDINGNFDLSATKNDRNALQLVLWVDHYCNTVPSCPCKRKWVLNLPTKYITMARIPRKTLNIEKWNLEAKLPNEKCLLQSIAVKGRLMCGSKPEGNVRVKLIDEDDGIDPDDELDAGYTDSSGNFLLSGDTSEFSTIDPVFKAYHDCNDGAVPCQRKWKIKLPEKYITKGRNPKKTLDLGILNLEIEMPDEEHDCSH